MKLVGRVVLLMVLVSKIGTAGEVDPTKIEAIFADLKSNTAPGGAVLVIKDGRAVFSRGYGVTDLRSLGKIDAHTNFRLASVSKQFTAMAIILLVHDGKLRYDERLTDIFPDFPAYGRAISVRHLLNHTSGLQDYEDLMSAGRCVSPEKIFQIKDAGVLTLLRQQTATKFAPGTSWEYSNSGYAVLAMIVEKVSDEEFGQFLQERIFGPLKMRNTVAYDRGKNEVLHRAYGHSRKEGVWQETDQSPTSAVLGDGGIYSSLDDLAKWDEALRQHRLVSESEMRPVQSRGCQCGSARAESGGHVSSALSGFEAWLWRRWSGRRRRMVTGVHQVFQFLAGLEEWNFLSGNFHPVARLWIAAHTGLALAGAKAAKATNLDLVAYPKRAHDAVEDGLDDDFTILARQLGQAGDFIDQISFCHTRFAP